MSGPAPRLGPFDTTVDPATVARFHDAVGHPSTPAPGGAVAPMLLAVALWEAQEAGRAEAVPAAIQQAATGGVHGSHDLVLHRPVLAGEPLRTWVERHGVRPAGANAAVTVRYRTVDAGDVVVAEQWWTTVYLGITGRPEGEAAPDHRFPEGARTSPVGTATVAIDDGMARRYAEASGDWSAHHFDPEAARASGSDRPFLHGLATMALCVRAVADLAAGGDQGRLSRLAVRFAAPAPIGADLTVAVHDAGSLGLAFEAAAGGVTVLCHGRAEMRDRP